MSLPRNCMDMSGSTPTSNAAYGTKYRDMHPMSTSIAACIENDFSDFLRGDSTALKNLVDMNVYLYERVLALENKAMISTTGFQQLQAKANALERENHYFKNEQSVLNFKIASLEDVTKRMNLRVEGVPEAANESLRATISDYLSKTGVTCLPGDIDFVRRIGKYRQGSTRPVMVKLIKEGLRNDILYKKKI